MHSPASRPSVRMRRALGLPNSAGTEPLSALPWNQALSRLATRPSVAGIEPVNQFPGRIRNSRLARLPNSSGMEPVNPLFLAAPATSTPTECESTVVGRAVLNATTLRLETNPRARADALRERIAAACGPRLRHRAREHSDPLALLNSAARPPRAPATPEEESLVAEFKARHYADWADRPLPALGDRTPRECMRTAAGRRAVDLLLTDMEHLEHRGPGQPFDFSIIRRDLGLTPR